MEIKEYLKGLGLEKQELFISKKGILGFETKLLSDVIDDFVKLNLPIVGVKFSEKEVRTLNLLMDVDLIKLKAVLPDNENTLELENEYRKIRDKIKKT